MKYYSADKNTFLDGKYKDIYEANGNWPADAVYISEEIFTEYAVKSAPEGKIRVAGENGLPEWADAPKPTSSQIVASKIAAVQVHMDAAARALGYDDIKTAVTYADEPAAPKFQAEGQAFRAWRSLVWAKCYEILVEVEAGTRDIPTDAELIAELPALALPQA